MSPGVMYLFRIFIMKMKPKLTQKEYSFHLLSLKR